MKRNETMVWIMLTDSVVFPALVGLSRLFGYTLRVGNGLVYALAASALYVFCAARLLREEDRQIGTAAMAALSVTLLLNQLQALFFICYVFYVSSSGVCLPAMLLLALWFWVTVAVTAAYVSSTALKAVFYSLSGLLVLPVCLFILLSGFGVFTVTESSVSPGYTYCAEVIERDEGALGGSVTVNVHRCKGSFSIGTFDFIKDETEVFHGKWGSVRDVRWTDDEHLICNNTTYTVSLLYDE